MPDEQSDEYLAQEADNGMHGQGAIAKIMIRLKASINNLNETSSKQQDEIIKLTNSTKRLSCVMLIMTFVLVVFGGISVIPILLSLVKWLIKLLS